MEQSVVNNRICFFYNKVLMRFTPGNLLTSSHAQCIKLAFSIFECYIIAQNEDGDEKHPCWPLVGTIKGHETL